MADDAATPRKCLRCLREFLSEGIGNRLCRLCRRDRGWSNMGRITRGCGHLNNGTRRIGPARGGSRE